MKSLLVGSTLCATLSLGFKMQEKSQTALAVADPQQCIQEKCPNQWAACQKDPKCIPALQDCEKKCGTKESCWQFCLPAKGSQAAIDVAKCAAANKCLGASEEVKPIVEESTALMVADPQQCIQEKCPTQWAACQKDPKCIPALQDCQKKCGTKESCWTFCLPSKGSQAAIDVAKCAQANNCLTSEEPSTALVLADPQQCIQEKCPNQWAACQKDPKCIPALQDCEKKCGTKESCWQFCLPAKGSQAAIDVAKCAAANKCLGTPEVVEVSTALVVADPQQCIQEKCPTQWASCQKDPKCIPALQDCEKKCGSKESCWKTCLVTKGDQAAIDVAKCAAANNCLASPQEKSTALMVADPQQCIQQKCPDQWAACQKDSKCIPALQDCEKKCGTKQSCWTFCLPSKGSQAAIDVAKCAAANNCLSASIFPYAFESCVSKKCTNPFSECLADEECRADLRTCKKPNEMWNFDVDCLFIKSDFNEKLKTFFDCAGQSKCI